MRRSLKTPFFLASILCALLVSTPARAVTKTRVFLGLNGSDSNDCSNPATPCASFAGALAQVAVGGEVIVEATGGYGPLNITQPVSINSAAGVVAFSCCQVNVDTGGGTVVLRGLTIDGHGKAENGINVKSVEFLHIESCVITGFTGSSATAGNGLFVESASSLLYIKDTIVRNNGNIGIWILPITPSGFNTWASIDHCRLEENATGLDAGINSFVTIRDSVASGNTAGYGLFSHGELNVENCLAAGGNYTGIGVADGALARVSNTTVTNNRIGLSFTGRGLLLSRSNNTVEGNPFGNGTFTGTFSAR
jgi:hypothetical protein